MNKKIQGLDLDLIAWDMVDMGIYKIKDIMQYGFTLEEAQIIQKEIDKR